MSSRAGRRIVCAALALAAIALVGSAPAAAQEEYTVSIGVYAGLGDSFNTDEGEGEGSFQLAAELVTDRRSRLGLRYGKLGFSTDTVFDNVTDPSLSYITVAGEYRFPENYFESGLYLGLGSYKLDGVLISTGEAFDERAFGVVLGATGEFSITRRFAIQVEGAGHYADLEPGQIFITGHIGLAFRF